MSAVQISGAKFPSQIVGRFGSYKDGSGNLWIIAYDASSKPTAYKSSDNGATWGTSYSWTSAYGASNFLDSVFDSANGVIYVICHQAAGGILTIASFTIGTTTWAEVYTSGTRPTVNTDVNSKLTAFLTRRSTGEFVVFYQGPMHRLMGTDYRACYYALCSAAGVWSAGVEVSGAVKTTNYDAKNAVLGESNRAHFFYSDGTNIVHRSVSGTTLDTSGNVGGADSGLYLTAYYDATLGKVVVGPLLTSTPLIYRATSGAGPTWTADTNAIGSPEPTASPPAFIYDPTGAKLYVFYRDATSDDVYVNSTASTTWTTANATYQDGALVFYDNSGSSTQAVGASSNDEATGQTFKCFAGRPTSVWIELAAPQGSPTDGIYIEIRSTSFTGTVLATSDTVIPSGSGWLQLPLPSPPTLAANTTYYLTVKRVGSLDINNFYYVKNSAPGNSYADGSAYELSLGSWTSKSVSLSFGIGGNLTAATTGISVGLITDAIGVIYNNNGTVYFDKYHLPVDYTESATISGVTSISAIEGYSYHDEATGLLEVTSVSTQDLNIAQSSGARLRSQSFKINKDVWINDVKFYLGKTGTPTSDLLIQLRTDDGTGLPSSTVITSTTITQASLDTTITEKTITFPDLVKISANTLYHVVFSRVDGAVDGTNFYRFRATTSDNYTDGQASVSAGSTWSGSSFDMLFKVDYTISENVPQTFTTVSSSEEYTPGSSGQYTDAITVTSVTTPSAVETAQKVDATTTASVTTPSAVETSQKVESATIASITTPSSTELHTISDAATISSVTTPSAVETAQFINAATVAGVTTPTSSELHELFDAATTAGKTTPTSTEVAAYVDSATIGGATTPSTVELYERLDAATVGSVTNASGQDIAAFVETATIGGTTTVTEIGADVLTTLDEDTISGTTSPSGTDIYDVLDSGTVSGLTSPSTVDTAQFVESATLSGITSIDSSEIYTPLAGTEYTDTATLSSVTIPSATEEAAYVDSETTSLVTSLTSTELHELFDVATISATTELSAMEVAGYVDSSTASTITDVISAEFHELFDQDTIAGFTSTTYTELAAYVEAATITSATNVSTDEAHVISDADTVNGSTTPSAEEIAQFVDSDTTAGTTTISVAEIVGFVDDAIFSTVSSLSAVELADFSDVAIVESDTNLVSSDVAAYIDSDTVTNITTIGGEELYIPYGGTELIDAATIASTTSIQSTESREITDASTVGGQTSIETIEFAEFIEAATATTTTTLSSIDTAAILDSATISGLSSLISDERADYTDSDTANSSTQITSQEITAYADAETTPTNTSITFVELHEISDSATISSNTLPSADETTQYVDLFTVSSATVASGTETHEIPDSATIENDTTISAVEVIAVIDAASLSSITALSSTELAEYVDSATLTSITEVFSEEVVTGVKVTTPYRTRLNALYLPTPLDPEYLSVTTRKANPTDSGIARVTFYSGATLIDTWDIILTDDFATDTHQLANTDLIADWGDLEVSVQGISDTGFDLTIQVSAVGFETPAYIVYEYDDSDTIGSITNVISVDILAAFDSDTIGNVTEPSAVEIAVYDDSSIIISNNNISSTEITQFTEINTIPTSTEITSEETAQYIDISTVPSSTIPSATDYVAYLDSATIFTIGAVSTSDVAAFIDLATLSGSTSITSFEGQTNTYVDASTVEFITSPTSSEYADYRDDTIVLCSNSVSTTEYYAAADSGDVGGYTSIYSIDLAGFVDSATLLNTTTPIGSEDRGVTYEDTNTFETATSISYTEYTIYADRETLSTTTLLSSAEETTYLDYATADSYTFIETEEVYKPLIADEATLTTITTVGGVEFILVIAPELYVVRSFKRWASTGTQLRSAPVVVYKRWSAANFGKRFTSESKRKWTTWIH